MSQQAPLDPLFLTFQEALTGRYSIDRELGRGGMGIVYLAREVHLDRPVAIKLLPPERAALRQRFLREARLAAKLSHPNIIPIHAVDDIGGFVFYVMAFIDGITLAERVRTRGPLPASEGARVLREAAWALAHAHAQGLVHRDVKPDNILLEAGSGRALVADFGIAAVAEDAGGTVVAGTPEFMSPEQALGKPLDARSDLYSLGATAYFAFSGRLPYEGATATEILARHVTAPPPSLSMLGLPVPRKLALLVDRCLAKEPDHRPASATALAEQLGVALEQRRELPAALRAFVKRSGRIDGGGTLLYGFGLLSGAITMSHYLGTLWAYGTLIVGVTAVPYGYLTVVARRLMRQGFTHQDLSPAFQGEIDQAREERSVGKAGGPGPLETILRRLAKAGAAVWAMATVGIFGMLIPGTPRWLMGLQGIMGISWSLAAMTTSASTLGYVALVQGRRDVDTEFWARVWMGKLGRGVFGLARRLVSRKAIGTAMTHRATELALGMAAEQLFEGLPKETRRSLGDLPATLRRLQVDAQTLRGHLDTLQEALNDAGDAASTDGYAEVRLHRDALKGQLEDAVGALETIRLNLLRLHAGTASVEGLTTHIELAAEVSAGVARLVNAHADIERALQAPRSTPTPA